MRRYFSGAIAIVLVVYGIVVLRNAWLSDDAYITFRTVDQFLTGNGLVWNMGERVQAYTHPLWMLVISFARVLSGEFFYTSLVVSVAISVAAVTLALRLTWQQTFATLLLGWLFILSKAFVEYSTSGLENPLSHLLLAFFLGLYLRDGFSRQRLAWLTLLTALALLTRHDLLLIFGPALLWYAWQGRAELREWRGAWWVLPLAMLPFVAWELFSLLYYGFPFPNTAYAKLNTALPKLELLHQGILYLLTTIAIDPVTPLIVLLALLGIGWGARVKYRVMVVSMALYLLYIIYVGGDFMVGRFWSLPFFGAATLLVWRVQHARPQLVMIALVATVVGLLNPRQSPLLFKPFEPVGQILESGITDEKEYYFAAQGLMPATRVNRLLLQGFKEDPVDPWSIECGGLGVRGFISTPFTHIIDQCGLADPLLARLPVRNELNWRVGHFSRTIPAGYLGTLRTGENLLVDPQLALYYDKLRILTQGPIFSWARLLEIWRFNTGQYNHLINPVAYVYPDATRVRFDEVTRGQWGDVREVEPPRATYDGYFITFTEGIPAGHLLVGLKCDTLAVNYYPLGDAENFPHAPPLASQIVRTAQVHFGRTSLVLLDVPANVTAAGGVQLQLVPRACEDVALKFVDTIPSRAADAQNASAENFSQPSLAQLLDVYFFQFHKLHGAARTTVLDELTARIAQFDGAAWQEIGVDKRVALFNLPTNLATNLPNGALYTVMVNAFGDRLPVVHWADAPTMRYLGTTLEEKGGEFELDLYFEMLAHLDAKFTLELRADLEASDGESFTERLVEADAKWEAGTLQEISTQLSLPADATNFVVCLIPDEPATDTEAEQCWPM